MKSPYYLTFLVICLISFSAVSASTQIGFDEEASVNFELILLSHEGNFLREQYAIYIKEALSRIGIEVNIISKPWGQFVGDLIRLPSGQPYDLAIAGFAGGGPYPSFMWKFHSTTTVFGNIIYQLNNPDWKEFMASDLDITTEDIDTLIESIDLELDPLVRWEQTQKFAEIFMNQLIYDIPLLTITNLISMWKGYGGSNNELWNPQEGVSGSWRIGAGWELAATPHTRLNQANSTTLQLGIDNRELINNGDTVQSFSASTDWLFESLLNYDSAYNPHPGVAYNWVVEDYIWNNHTTTPGDDLWVEHGRHIFYLGRNHTWTPTTTYEGSVVPEEIVDANDFKLTLDMYNDALAGKYVNVLGGEIYDNVWNYYVNSTLSTNDTLIVELLPGKVRAEDFVTLGNLMPYPDHLLGGDLHVATVPGGLTPNGTITSLGDGSLYNFQNTVEWNWWERFDGGFTDNGPFDIAEFDEKTGILSKFYRDTYSMPNELDTEQYYSANSSMWSTIYKDLKTTTWPGMNMSVFAPHTQPNHIPYFFAWEGHETKVSGPNVRHIIYKTINDTDTLVTKFEAGEIDAINPSVIDTNLVISYSSNTDFVLKEIEQLNGPQLLIMNLLNPHLRKRDVRYAIHSALDKETMSEINHGFSKPTDSPVWRVYDQYKPPVFNKMNLSWYTDEYRVPYDLEVAKSLMETNGYTLVDLNSTETPDKTTKPSSKATSALRLMSPLILVPVIIILVRKKYQ